MLQRTISRRSLLTAAGAGLGYALLARSGWAAQPQPQANQPLAWVWRFDDDGPMDEVRSVLAANGLGIILKTHDGDSWMGRWSQTPVPILGAGEIMPLVRYFESAGVPFHAWCVVEGLDPIREAQMAAEVVGAGVRSLVFDLEPRDGPNYWGGDSQAAIAFGRELRRLQPNAHLSVAPDPRPWQLEVVPIAEFAGFCNDIVPQTYWKTFDTSANYRLLAERGFPVSDEGVTPELILNVSKYALQGYGKPLRPAGQASAGPDDWRRFAGHAQSLGMQSLTVWRFGTADGGLWPVIRETSGPATKAQRVTPEAVAATPTPQPAASSGQQQAGRPSASAPADGDSAGSAAPEATPEDRAPFASAGSSSSSPLAARPQPSTETPSARDLFQRFFKTADEQKSSIWRSVLRDAK